MTEPTEEERTAALAQTMAAFEDMAKAAGDDLLKVKTFTSVIGTLYKNIWAAFTKQRRKIEALQNDVGELKAARPTLADCYRGTWQPSQFDAYQRGTAVTFGGSLWIARTDTRSKPGTDDSWQMAVKAGRDGKDATS